MHDYDWNGPRPNTKPVEHKETIEVKDVKDSKDSKPEEKVTVSET